MPYFMPAHIHGIAVTKALYNCCTKIIQKIITHNRIKHRSSTQLCMYT